MNKRCKERMCELAIAAVVLALIFTPIIAARGVELSVNAPEEVGEGSTFEVSIDVEDIDDLNSAKFDLSFDSSVVNVTNVSDGNVDGTTIPAQMWIAEAGIINVIVDIPGIDGVSGSGSLATVSFEVVGGKRDESVLEISNVQLVDDEAEFIEVGKLSGAEIEVVDVIEVVEEKEEGEEEQPPGITAWEPTEEVINSTEGESITFEISVDQEVDISWQINGTEVQVDEGVTKAAYTNTSAVAGTWNVSAIATNTETRLSTMYTWIWSVTSASTEASEGTPTPTPTLTSGVTPTPTPKATSSPGQTVKSTPTVKPTSTPKSKETTPTPTSKTPGFEAIFAIAAMSAIAYALVRRR
ncbi:MAG: PGF-CTERM sorting domain-containing protein [Methanophagales archaeon]|nr:PGF-CTERM sorting domain-containing protein [Methanophagales archaeon]